MVKKKATERSVNKKLSLNESFSRIGEDAIIEGTIEFTSTLSLSGSFSGEINAEEGTLILTDKANIGANIKVNSLSSQGGVVRGDVSVKEKLELLEESELHGNIETSRLVVQEGVSFGGYCSMVKKSDDLDLMSMDISLYRNEMEKRRKETFSLSSSNKSRKVVEDSEPETIIKENLKEENKEEPPVEELEETDVTLEEPKEEIEIAQEEETVEDSSSLEDTKESNDNHDLEENNNENSEELNKEENKRINKKKKSKNKPS